MPSGEHFHAMFRDGTRRYTSRPPANCRSAREAWDYHAQKGPIVWLQLLDGYWGAGRESGEIDETENTFAANRWLASDAASGWIEWVGGRCAVAPGTRVDVRHRDGNEFFGHLALVHNVSSFAASDWAFTGVYTDIVAYRVVA